MKAFMAALESMNRDPLQIGEIPPSPSIVNKYFNDSTGQGDDGERDVRGPWNEADGMEYLEAPARKIAQATQEEVSREIFQAARRRSRAPSRRSNRRLR